MVRLKRNRLKPYKIFKYVVKTNNEGVRFKGYENNPDIINAEIYPASGRVQAQIYGEKLSYIMNMLVERSAEIKERDGICIDSDVPNYEVVSIKNYTFHKFVELQKL